jgi:hypothetical protein
MHESVSKGEVLLLLALLFAMMFVGAIFAEDTEPLLKRKSQKVIRPAATAKVAPAAKLGRRATGSGSARTGIPY